VYLHVKLQSSNIAHCQRRCRTQKQTKRTLSLYTVSQYKENYMKAHSGNFVTNFPHFLLNVKMTKFLTTHAKVFTVVDGIGFRYSVRVPQ